MTTKTNKLLLIMNVFAWIAFVLLIVKAGAYLVSYGFCISKPIAAKDFYNGMDLSALRDYDFVHFSAHVLMMALVIGFEAYIAYLVIKVLSKIKMAGPFTTEISALLERIGYFIILTWVAAMLYNGHAYWLMKKVPGLQLSMVSGEFIVMAGVVFVFTLIFRKGVEIQTENELTV